jgi:GNAT superfamily N-acetyltransferase
MNTVVAPIGEMAPADDGALPIEWAQWAEEPGKVIRLEDDDGAIVGRVHAVVVGRAEAWIEGLWVTPTSRRTGLGRRLLTEVDVLFKDYGIGVIRAAVPAHNRGALALTERAGYVPCARAVVQILTVPREAGSSGDAPTVRPATASEAPVLVKTLTAAALLKPWHGLLPLGWRFRRAGLELLRGLAKEGRVLVTTEPGGIAIVALGRDAAVITALTGDTAQAGRLVRATAVQGASERVVVFAPDASAVADLGVTVDPHVWCPEGLVIVEKTVRR